MGVALVWSLLLKMSLPVILSTAVQALYNIVDGIFVAMISENALSAITYAMPMYTILTALGTGIAVGMNTMLSKALGEKNQKEVNDAASAAIFLVLLTNRRIQKALHIVLIVIFIIIVLHKKCHVLEKFPVFHIFI